MLSRIFQPAFFVATLLLVVAPRGSMAQSRSEVLATVDRAAARDPSISLDWSNADSESRLGTSLYLSAALLTSAGLVLTSIAGLSTFTLFNAPSPETRRGQERQARDYYIAGGAVLFAAIVSLGLAIGFDVDSSTKHRRTYRRALELSRPSVADLRLHVDASSEGATLQFSGRF